MRRPEYVLSLKNWIAPEHPRVRRAPKAAPQGSGDRLTPKERAVWLNTRTAA
jgi:hypothetical protein